MTIGNNLLYLLLLFAVLDKENKLSVTTGLLIAIGIMLFGACCNPCGNRFNNCNGNPNIGLNSNFAFANGIAV